MTCFFQIAYPERHCPNVGAWYNPALPAPVNEWTWCWEHKHHDDVRVVARPMEPTPELVDESERRRSM